VNPHVRLETYETALTSKNALDILSGYDIVVDGTDNSRPAISSTTPAYCRASPMCTEHFPVRGTGLGVRLADGPCYRCLFPEPPPPDWCRAAPKGESWRLAGLVGTIQATEAIKLIIGAGEPLKGRLLLIDTLGMQFRTVNVRKDPTCPACGTPRDSGADRLRAVLRRARAEAEPRAVAGFVEVTPRRASEPAGAGEELQLIDVREQFEWTSRTLMAPGSCRSRRYRRGRDARSQHRGGLGIARAGRAVARRRAISSMPGFAGSPTCREEFCAGSRM